MRADINSTRGGSAAATDRFGLGTSERLLHLETHAVVDLRVRGGKNW